MNVSLSPLAQALINRYQRGLPLVPEPYAAMAAELGVTEADVLDTLRELKRSGVLSRVGGVVAHGRVGASTLAAMAVPQEHLEEVAAIVSARPEVNHNYEREGELNLWFVVVAADEAALERTLHDLERDTGYPVEDLRLIKAYHIDLGFAV